MHSSVVRCILSIYLTIPDSSSTQRLVCSRSVIIKRQKNKRTILENLMEIRFEGKCYVTYTFVYMGQRSCFWNWRSPSSPPSLGWALLLSLGLINSHLFSQRLMFWEISASTLETNAICKPNFENLTFHNNSISTHLCLLGLTGSLMGLCWKLSSTLCSCWLGQKQRLTSPAPNPL